MAEALKLVDRKKPTLEEFLQANPTQRTGTCFVCHRLPADTRDEVNAALRKGIGPKRIVQWLKMDEEFVEASSGKIEHHKRDHLAQA